MILIVRHPSLCNVLVHAVQHGRQREIAFLAGNRNLRVNILLEILLREQEVQDLVCRLLVLAVRRHAELKVNAGVERIFCRIVICRHHKRVNVQIGID